MHAPRQDALAGIGLDHRQRAAMRERLHQIARRVGRQMRDDHHRRRETRGQRAEQHVQHFDPARRAADHHEIVDARLSGARLSGMRLGIGR